MRDLTFSQESVADVEREIQPLLLANWATVAKHYPDSTFAPNLQVYRDLAAADALRIFTVRSGKDLVGYAVVFLIRHPHRSDDLVGTLDTFFILEGHRQGGVAIAFLRYVEERLHDDGVSVVLFATRDPLLCRWLRSIAHYEPTETVFERRV